MIRFRGQSLKGHVRPKILLLNYEQEPSQPKLHTYTQKVNTWERDL